MPASYLHGFEFIESAQLRPIQMVRSSVIGLVGTAPKGDVNKITLITNRSEAVAKFGNDTDFSIPAALDAIFDQGDYIGFVVAVNVLDPTSHKTAVSNVEKTFDTKDKIQLEHKQVRNEVVKNQVGVVTYVKGTDYSINYETGTITRITGGAILTGAIVKISYDWLDVSKVLTAAVVGGVDEVTGDNEGIEALLDASSVYGIAPKILIAPGYSSSKTVMDALISKAETLRSVAIADSSAGATVENAIAYRGQFDSPRAIVTYPRLEIDDGQGGKKIVPYSAYLAGVMSRTDNELGFWYSPSNKIIKGVTALERPIPYIAFSSPNSLANYLNEVKIVTAILYDGFRVWGNRSATTDSAWHFISVRRQFDIIEDSIEIGTLHLLDRPINKAFFEDLQDSVQAFLNSLVGRQAIIYGKITIAPEDNPPAQIANGHVTARIDITPTYPAERITYNVTLTIEQLKKLFE